MNPPARPHLLGFWMCVALVVGNSIGSGVFLLRLQWTGRLRSNDSGASRGGTVSLAVVGVAAASYSLWAIVGAGAEAVLWGGALLALGAPVYFVVRSKS